MDGCDGGNVYGERFGETHLYPQYKPYRNKEHIRTWSFMAVNHVQFDAPARGDEKVFKVRLRYNRPKCAVYIFWALYRV